MKFRIALAQADSRLFDKVANLEKAERTIRQAAAEGAAMIIFPELYLTGYTLGDRVLEMAEPQDGPCVRQVARAARENGIAVIMGYAELSGTGNFAFDAVFVVDESGRALGSYRKTHLYDQENEWFVPGAELCVLDSTSGRFGPMICYDIEFPEVPRLLALQGAEWLAVSTGNMRPNEHGQHIYVQSRALENHVWLALANRVGREGDIEFFGGSALSDPFGNLVAQAGDEETLLFADIDLSLNSRARLNGDYLTDRKPDLYHALARKQ